MAYVSFLSFFLVCGNVSVDGILLRTASLFSLNAYLGAGEEEGEEEEEAEEEGIIVICGWHWLAKSSSHITCMTLMTDAQHGGGRKNVRCCCHHSERKVTVL